MSSQFINPMLHIDEDAQTDDSIQSYKRFAFQPITGTDYNNASPIVIRVENSDSYFRPCDSEIEFEGEIVKETGGGAFTKAEALLALINNGLLYLFDNIKYELSWDLMGYSHQLKLIMCTSLDKRQPCLDF